MGRRDLMPCHRSNSSAPSVEDERDDGVADGGASNQGSSEKNRGAFSRASRAVRIANEISQAGHHHHDNIEDDRTGAAQSSSGAAMRSMGAAMRSIGAAQALSAPAMRSMGAAQSLSAPALQVNRENEHGNASPTLAVGGSSSSKPPQRSADYSNDPSGSKRPEPGSAGPVPTAGCLPPRSPERKEMQYDELPQKPQAQAVRNLTADAARMLDRDAPYLSAVMQYLTAGRVDHALQCAFQYGNEKTLRSALQLLNPRATWSQLPGDVAAYLAHVLVLLLCKDPLSEKAKEACVWLEGLVRIPGGREALARENQQELGKALFCLSGVPGEGGTLASWLYYQLFQDAR